MGRDEVLSLLRAHKSEIMSRFGVAELALFGSVALGQAIERSDVDILARYDPGMIEFSQLKG